MDTIIYLYKLKGTDRQAEGAHALPELHIEELYEREDFCLRDYHLTRVGMREELVQICMGDTEEESSRRKKGSGGFFAKRRRRKRRREELLYREQFLHSIREDADHTVFVCEKPIPYFAPWEFNGYFQPDWVEHLLRYGEGLHDVLILGQANCLSELMYPRAQSFRSLRWIVPERQFKREQEELVDILYEEYGLAVELRLLGEDEHYRQSRIACRQPSLVLDFSEEDRIPTADVARGSVWLDMACSEEKRRRMEDRDTGISYFSLKKEWKQPQKALNYLDTISKNGYNT